MKKILIIEDDPFLSEIYRSMLMEQGFEVETVGGGEEGFSRLLQERFDLLLLDLVLPEMNGFEILEKIKKNEELKDIKVLILSNLGDKEEVERGLKLGADKYLIKAYSPPSEVVDEIKKMLR